MQPTVMIQKSAFVSWKARGWCRLEHLAFFLKDHKAGIIPDTFRFTGDPEEDCKPAREFGAVAAYRTSIFNGKFACCQLQHMDLSGKPMQCDKEKIVEVLSDLYKTLAQDLGAYTSRMLSSKLCKSEA